MNNLSDLVWIELRKAVRSRMPLWTALGSLLMPLGIAFLIFVAKNPEISQKLGLISAKANLIAYSATDWPTYLTVAAQMIAAGGFFLFVLAVSWIFGREFADGTLKDMLAVPVRRWNIILAKYVVITIWSFGLTVVIFITSLIMGFVLQLPGGSFGTLLKNSPILVVTSGLTIAVVLPFALFASLGRGYLLPLGMAVVTLMLTNLVVIVGWGEYFPWSLPMLYAQGKSSLTSTSYWIVCLTCLVGVLATIVWWQRADQDR